MGPLGRPPAPPLSEQPRLWTARLQPAMQRLALALALPIPILTLACRPDDGFEIQLEQSQAIPTVYTATWSVDAEEIDDAWWELGRDGQVERTVPVDPASGPDFETVLVGMKPGSEYSLWAVVEAGGETQRSAEWRVETGLPPAELPDLTLGRVAGAETWWGLLVTTVAAMPPTAVILDEDGEYVWWHTMDGVDGLSRAHLAPDGRSMYLLDMNLNDDVEAALYRVGLDGTDFEALPSASFHHDFVPLPDGTLAALVYDPVEIDGISVPGDLVVELAPDGSTRVVYDVWADPDIEYHASDAYMGRMWPHANAIDYLEEEDAYLVSFLAFESIARIDRTSGAVDWRLGGDLSDFTLIDGETDLFDHQHQFQWLDDSILVFENGPMTMGVSAAVEYAVNLDDFGLWQSWEHSSSQGLSSMILGDVHRLDSGNTLITWSYGGVIEEVEPAGTSVWSVEASVGGAFGYTTWLESLPAQ